MEAFPLHMPAFYVNVQLPFLILGDRGIVYVFSEKLYLLYVFRSASLKISAENQDVI